ncbi:Hypothetical protein R9X50_00120900 [Acrodontium crateriforme]|uniref:Glycosyl transferase CAP10 domain-containing protein n=1 Tax=Acrodontium crateriforme TaxID=150365 RepID=A0AAQ3LYY1_9PEZI|nr:Hypothetical protein R9X50_00120900 [Acrodontium crateriforme]
MKFVFRCLFLLLCLSTRNFQQPLKRAMAAIVSPSRLAGRCKRVLLLIGILLPAMFVWSLWYAINSDRDDVHSLLSQLIPAGHCACKTSTIFECTSCFHPAPDPEINATAFDAKSWRFDLKQDGRNLGLGEEQCDSAFPGLYEDVNLAEKHWLNTGRITRKMLDDVELVDGMTRAMIYDGHLYIIASKSRGEDHRRKALAVLSAIQRALAPAHDQKYRFEFIFSIEDKASDVVGGHEKPLWVVARKADESSYWLIPDFGYWAWDNVIHDFTNEVGPYDEIVDNARHLEKGMAFPHKEQKLVWRGKLSFAPKLRRALLDQSRDHPWSDVKELQWDVRNNYLKLEDHCKYQFIAHAEGRSYSASLKYRQACRSVIVTHKLQYIQHHHYLLVSKGPLQNYVEVERDFSNLASKMDNLLDNPKKADKIAENSVKTFRDRYLTPAADACYWRALWRTYSRVSEQATLWSSTKLDGRQKRGLRYESYVMLSSEEMLDFNVVYN